MHICLGFCNIMVQKVHFPMQFTEQSFQNLHKSIFSDILTNWKVFYLSYRTKTGFHECHRHGDESLPYSCTWATWQRHARSSALNPRHVLSHVQPPKGSPCHAQYQLSSFPPRQNGVFHLMGRKHAPIPHIVGQMDGCRYVLLTLPHVCRNQNYHKRKKTWTTECRQGEKS